MSIAKKPKRNLTAVAKSDPMAFILEPTAEPRRKRKEPVIIRFDEATLERVDRAAARRGLSRAALVRMLVIEHLAD
jgi:predicted DNA binding CopG/RHH family protein